MRARSRKILITLAAIFTIVVIAVALFDWNILKPYVERQVTHKTGREFIIRGNLDVNLSLNPKISVEGLSLANADWGTGQPMLATERLSFRINPWKLLWGEIVLPELSISRPEILLEKSLEGKRNWVLQKEEKEAELPKIGRLTIDQGTLIFRDPKTETDVTARIATDSTSADARETPINILAEGKFTSLKFSSQIHGGEVMSLMDKNRAYPIKGNVQIGTTHAAFDGTITGLQTLSAMDLKLEVRGDDLSALYPITGIVVFPSPPYRVSGRLQHQKTEWSLKGFTGDVGTSDLGGDILFDTGGERPMLRGDVVSQSLDLEDLRGFIGARKGPQPQDSPAKKEKKKASIAAQRDRLLPDQEFRVDRLRAMDADIKFTGQSIRNKDLPVKQLVSHTRIENGLMALDTDFVVAGGSINADVTINARGDLPAGEAQVDFKKLELPKLFPKSELTHDSSGLIGGRARIKSQGKSVGALLGSADGRFGLIMSGGQISNMMLEIIGLDGAEILRFLVTGDKNVKVRCAVADFDIKKGMMKSEAFVIDTTDTNILGEGQISLADETIKMKISPEPKDFSIVSLRTPVHISGTFKEPVIYPDKMLAIRVGAAVLLGIFATPLASLIPLIETGPGEDHNCRSLIASVKKPLPAQKENPQTEKKK
ncbi:AsmA family protein [Nitrosospira sp. NpAV]|uniref:AsmA family protein n=1 Tax=Nitrosospira sp. NpAV TaxID=58133 RepID=UPI0005A2DA3F|nr:AsmA family protein [Nitrosospira sp. NpAV]KIO48880.1 AsmA [Nitrosospira sp. NpAV]